MSNSQQMNLPLGRRLKKAGQLRALTAESIRFKQVAREALVRAAVKKFEVTADDLWDEMPADCLPDHPNCVGAIFRWAAHAKMITATDRSIQSAKVAAHARRVQIWTSNIYRGSHD